MYNKLDKKAIDNTFCVMYNTKYKMYSILDNTQGVSKEVFNVINNNFSAILGAKRLKITDVSKNTGISRTTLTNLYYDRNTTISLETLDKLCGYLQCGVGDLFEHKE